MGNFRWPAEAGSVSQTTPTGSDASLAGPVFDPFDIPFLPLWPGEFPSVYPRFAPVRGLVAVSDGHRDIERKIGNVRKGVGEIQHVQR